MFPSVDRWVLHVAQAYTCFVWFRETTASIALDMYHLSGSTLLDKVWVQQWVSISIAVLLYSMDGHVEL